MATTPASSPTDAGRQRQLVARSIAAQYDNDDQLKAQSFAGFVMALTWDAAGNATDRTYTKSTCATQCALVEDHVKLDAQDRWIAERTTGTGRIAAGRSPTTTPTDSARVDDKPMLPASARHASTPTTGGGARQQSHLTEDLPRRGGERLLEDDRAGNQVLDLRWR